MVLSRTENILLYNKYFRKETITSDNPSQHPLHYTINIFDIKL